MLFFTKKIQPPPTRVFDGYLKQHTQADRTEQTDFVFQQAFPGFSEGTNYAPSAVDKIFREVEAEFKIETVDMSTKSPSRRFSGDLGKFRFIGRGNYSTVCSDALGNDGGTLANELEAYAHPLVFETSGPKISGYVRVIDLAMPNPFVPHVVPNNIPALGVLTVDLPYAASKLKAEYEKKFGSTNSGPLFITVPYTVRHERIERVFDLRYPDARDWLAATFANGVKGYLEYHGPRLPKDFDFFSLWPSLFGIESGGGQLDDVIARYLQDQGVQALIFPSARSDAGVVFENGSLREFRGWNLVDYRGLNRSRDVVPLGMWMTPWIAELPGGRRFLVAPNNEKFAGSFRVERAEYARRANRHFAMVLKLADRWMKSGEPGEDRSVREYVWHRTSWALQDGEHRIALNCQNCDAPVSWESNKSGGAMLFDAPDKCPVCGYNAPSI